MKIRGFASKKKMKKKKNSLESARVYLTVRRRITLKVGGVEEGGAQRMMREL